MTQNIMLGTIFVMRSYSWGENEKGDKFSLAIIIVLVTIPSIYIFLKASKRLRNRKDNLPPGPRGLPLVGYLPFLGSSVHQLFMELVQVYGPIYKLSIGRKLCVIISSPSLVKEVVRDQDITFANRNPTVAAFAFSYGGNDIAFAPYGPTWLMLRKIFVREMQSGVVLEALYTLRKNEVSKSVSHVYGNIGMPINMGELAFSTVINMISSMFWGGTLEGEKGSSVAAEFRAATFKLTKIFGTPNVSDFFPMLAWFDIQGVEREMKKVSQWIEQIYDFVIRERIKMQVKKVDGSKKDEPKDFLQLLLEFKEQDTGRSISMAQIKALLNDIVVGGTSTTSTMIEWTMAELMLHPTVMRRDQEELAQVIGVDNIVEELNIHKLSYLHAVVKETLRMHPAAPLLLPRCPTKLCTIGGYTIPKGTKVFLNVWAMHRDLLFWDNPLEFRPDRFLDPSNKLDYFGNNLHYLPFGSGRRSCAGLQLGERMLMYTLATLLHMFDWKLPSGTMADTSEKFGIVLEKSTPLIAIPTPRLHNLEVYTYEKK
ncbi:p450 domain-containing protein [Cephalotus follicularis]|uniref:p450 domain-containing protein n=1 Tax=Cephalotus follicularis TaxID=3775 RepID=A0A1Q3BUT3_CEPFO|nr:p450 domain-containing protein [Cephalotus follicularis]